MDVAVLVGKSLAKRIIIVFLRPQCLYIWEMPTFYRIFCTHTHTTQQQQQHTHTESERTQQYRHLEVYEF